MQECAAAVESPVVGTVLSVWHRLHVSFSAVGTTGVIRATSCGAAPAVWASKIEELRARTTYEVTYAEECFKQLHYCVLSFVCMWIGKPIGTHCYTALWPVLGLDCVEVSRTYVFI